MSRIDIKDVFGFIIALAVFIFVMWATSDHKKETTQSYASQQSATSQEQGNAQVYDTSTVTKNPSVDTVGLNVYSGQCNYYRKVQTTMGSVKYEPMNSGLGKVVIDRKHKKLHFYYNGKLVFQYSGYISFADDNQGGEGFTFNSDADAHRFIAERVFQLNTERMNGQLGYQYEIANYIEN